MLLIIILKIKYLSIWLLAFCFMEHFRFIKPSCMCRQANILAIEIRPYYCVKLFIDTIRKYIKHCTNDNRRYFANSHGRNIFVIIVLEYGIYQSMYAVKMPYFNRLNIRLTTKKGKHYNTSIGVTVIE